MIPADLIAPRECARCKLWQAHDGETCWRCGGELLSSTAPEPGQDLPPATIPEAAA